MFQDQVDMVTSNIFEIIQGSKKHITKYLINDGYVYPLAFPGYKWKFLHAGTVLFLTFK